jgi:hypothetical protein
MSVVQVKIVLLLDLPQLLMLSVGTLTCLEPKPFLIILFCTDSFLIIEILSSR